MRIRPINQSAWARGKGDWVLTLGAIVDGTDKRKLNKHLRKNGFLLVWPKAETTTFISSMFSVI